MLAGSTDTGDGDAKAVNTGIINVKNEGFGMLAMNGGTVVNQGTINLTADEGVTKQQDNQLFAMGAIQGGLAINDQDGVININTDIGQAFYKDGTGTILNYGKINLSVIQWMKVIPTLALRRMTKIFSVSCLAAARASVKLQLATVLSQLITWQTMATKRLTATL